MEGQEYPKKINSKNELCLKMFHIQFKTYNNAIQKIQHIFVRICPS